MNIQRIKTLSAALAMAVAILAVPGSSAATQEAVLVLKGATLIDGTGAAPVANSIVVVRDGKFAAVGSSTLKFPAGATVVDVSGKFIIPGLVESHVHYEEWMGEIFLNHGVTSVFGLAVGGAFHPD